MTRFAAILLTLCLAASCRPPGTDSVTVEGFALGTTYRVVAKGAAARNVPDLRGSLDSLFAAASASMSIFDTTSLLSRLNRNETDSLNASIAYCIGIAERVSRASEGRYDITVLPLSEAWGFARSEAQPRPNVDSLLQYVGYEKIAVKEGRLVKADPGVRLDLNSLGKGATVDMAARLLESFGVEEYLVEVGGEIFCRGTNPRGVEWRVAVDRPLDGNYTPGAEIQTVVSVSDAGLATSGNYRRFYLDESGRKIAHTIDPVTGMSRVTDLLSATVIAGSCALADAYATMFMALGLEEARRHAANLPDPVEALFIYSDGNGDLRTWCTPGFASHMEQR